MQSSENVEDTVLVKVKTLQPSTHELRVPKKMSISELKLELASKVSEPPERQRLIFKGRALTDDQTLLQLGIEDGDTFHLVFRSPDAGPATEPSNQGAAEGATGRSTDIGRFLHGLLSTIGAGVGGPMPLGHVTISAGGMPFNLDSNLGAGGQPAAGSQAAAGSQSGSAASPAGIHLLTSLHRYLDRLNANAVQASPMSISSFGLPSMDISTEQYYTNMTTAAREILAGVTLDATTASLLEAAEQDPTGRNMPREASQIPPVTGTSIPYPYWPLVLSALRQLSERTASYLETHLAPALRESAGQLEGDAVRERFMSMPALHRLSSTLHAAAALLTELARAAAAAVVGTSGNTVALAMNGPAVLHPTNPQPMFPRLLPHAPGHPASVGPPDPMAGLTGPQALFQSMMNDLTSRRPNPPQPPQQPPAAGAPAAPSPEAPRATDAPRPTAQPRTGELPRMGFPGMPGRNIIHSESYTIELPSDGNPAGGFSVFGMPGLAANNPDAFERMFQESQMNLMLNLGLGPDDESLPGEPPSTSEEPPVPTDMQMASEMASFVGRSAADGIAANVRNTVRNLNITMTPEQLDTFSRTIQNRARMSAYCATENLVNRWTRQMRPLVQMRLHAMSDPLWSSMVRSGMQASREASEEAEAKRKAEEDVQAAAAAAAAAASVEEEATRAATLADQATTSGAGTSRDVEMESVPPQSEAEKEVPKGPKGLGLPLKAKKRAVSSGSNLESAGAGPSGAGGAADQSVVTGRKVVSRSSGIEGEARAGPPMDIASMLGAFLGAPGAGSSSSGTASSSAGDRPRGGLGGLMQMAAKIANDPSMQPRMQSAMSSLMGDGGAGSGGLGGLGDLLGGLLGGLGAESGSGSGLKVEEVVGSEVLKQLLDDELAGTWSAIIEADVAVQERMEDETVLSEVYRAGAATPSKSLLSGVEKAEDGGDDEEMEDV